MFYRTVLVGMSFAHSLSEMEQRGAGAVSGCLIRKHWRADRVDVPESIYENDR
jgi:hypothetical protein